MVADSDRRGNRASSTSTTTTCSETSYNSTTATIPLRVMTPEDANTPAVLSPVNEKVLEALLAEAPTLREFISSHKEVEGYKYVYLFISICHHSLFRTCIVLFLLAFSHA